MFMVPKSKRARSSATTSIYCNWTQLFQPWSWHNKRERTLVRQQIPIFLLDAIVFPFALYVSMASWSIRILDFKLFVCGDVGHTYEATMVLEQSEPSLFLRLLENV